MKRQLGYSRLQLITLLVLLPFCSSCGDDGSPAGLGNGAENDIQNTLSFRRQDGTTLSMGTDYAVCCGIWEEGFIDKNTLKIFFYDPTMELSFWKLFIIVDEITIGSSYVLPTTASSPLKMFLVDAMTSNELSSDDRESSGNVIVEALDCGPPVSLRVTLDATLGSEFFGAPAVQVSGTFSATIHSNPAPFGCDFSM